MKNNKEIILSVLKAFDKKIFNFGKCMIVAMSCKICVDLYIEIVSLRPVFLKMLKR